MKNLFKLFGVIAIVAVIGFSMAGCKETDPTPQTVTYEGNAEDVWYMLEIAENTARYTAQSGDSYKLTVGAKISTGTVEKNENEKLTLKHSAGGEFTATVSSSGITAMTGTIKFDGGGEQEAPTTITPAPPLDGTWEGSIMMDFGSGEVSTPARFVFSGKNWTMTSQNDHNDYVYVADGTFIVSGSKVTSTATNYWDGSGKHPNDGTVKPMEATRSGNTLIFTNGTVTKK